MPMKHRKAFVVSVGLAVLALAFAVWNGARLYQPPLLDGRLHTAVSPAQYEVGDFILNWEGERLAVAHRQRPQKTLWASLPGQSFVAAAQGRETVEEARGSFFIEDEIGVTCAEQTITAVTPIGDALAVAGSLNCGGGEQVGYTLTFRQPLPNQLRFSLALDDPAFNRSYLTYASNAAERFFGFGEQFSFFDFKGKRVPIFVMEQGIGRGAQPVTAVVDLVAQSGGDWSTTYAAVPHYLSSQLRSLFLENYEYSVFDLRQDDRVQIMTFSGEMNGRILHGDSPPALIESYTAYAGRMRPLPDWILSGAVVGMQGGTEKVRDVWRRLQAHDVPLAAFWLQDWQGQRTTSFGQQLWWNWELDQSRYPGWAQLVADLNEAGVEVMIYINPFLVDVAEKPDAGRNLFREAAAAGYLVQNEAGTPYLIENTDFSAGLLDLTEPAARQWMKEVIAEELIGAGAAGWMADFGEAFPYDAVTAAGADPARYHNRYPEAWAELNREAIAEAGREDDVVFFSRAGFTRSPRYTTLFWLGDQLVSWDEHDGIKTAVTGLLTSGLSGYAFNHSDVGGYTTLTSPIRDYHRSQELLLRWMELNAFTTVFRTHEGNDPAANVQAYSNEETLAHFARMGKVYAAWEFYRQELVAEAAATGLPVVRHPFIHYPDDPAVYEISYQQFMVGEELMVAPVLDEGERDVDVYLPHGRWVHLWSGRAYNGGQTVTVAAPPGQPGVFYREGTAVGAQFAANLEAAGIGVGENGYTEDTD